MHNVFVGAYISCSMERCRSTQPAEVLGWEMHFFLFCVEMLNWFRQQIKWILLSPAKNRKQFLQSSMWTQTHSIFPNSMNANIFLFVLWFRTNLLSANTCSGLLVVVTIENPGPRSVSNISLSLYRKQIITLILAQKQILNYSIRQTLCWLCWYREHAWHVQENI